MASPDSSTVDRVAHLARLEISDDTKVRIGSDLGKILQLIDVLEELDLDDVQPFFGVVGNEHDLSPKRSDVVDDSLTRDKALENAPKQDGEFYCVPPVFE